MLAVSMLRSLKGAPLACLVALMFAQRDGLGPQGAEWIERQTGYSDKPVGQALLLLEELGLIARNGRYAWQLSNGALQLPLMTGGEGTPPPGNLGLALPEKSPEALGVGNIPTPPSSSGGRFIRLIENGSTTTGESEKFRVRAEVLKALDEAGIREPARSRLAGLAHVTVELVEYHASTAETCGQAIYRIEHNWDVKSSANGYARNGQKYLEGTYSEFIVH